MATLSAPQPASASASATRRQVRNLALPAVGEQLLNTAVGLADIYLVGNLNVAVAERLGYTSATALAAAGLANQLVWLVTVVQIALGIGSTALVARAFGAKESASMERIVLQSMLLATVVGLVMTILGLLLAEPFLRVLNAPADSLPLAVQYIQISAFSFLPVALLFVGNACLRGVGDTRTPLLVMLGVNVVNILVTWALVNGNAGAVGLGVAGAAIGATIARIGGGVAVAGLLLRGHSGLRLVLSLRPDLETLQRIVRLALPTAGEQLIFQGALLIFVRFVTGLGTVAYAAHQVAITIESVSFLPGMGYAAATSALVGQALGARKPKQAEAYAYEALLQGGLMMSLGGLIIFLFPAQLLGIFINDPAVIAAAVAPLRAAGMVQPALGVSFILLGAMRGAGDTRWPLLSRVITTWAVRLPLTLVLVGWLGLGLGGIWLAMCADFTLQALLTIMRFRSGRWKRMRV